MSSQSNRSLAALRTAAFSDADMRPNRAFALLDIATVSAIRREYGATVQRNSDSAARGELT